MKNKNYKDTIAIIDDGVYLNTFINVDELMFSIEISDKVIYKKNDNSNETISHGTTCASIIKKYAPNSKIGSIKIIPDNNNRTSIYNLVKALEWCYDNNIKFIHMSLGSSDYSEISFLEDIIEKLLIKKCIIIAALNNNMKFSIPSCIDGVICVKHSSILKDDQFYKCDVGLFDADFVASSYHNLVKSNGDEYTTPLCNSYAAPLITANIYNDYQSNLSGILPLKTITFIEKLRNTSLVNNKFTIPIYRVNMNKEQVETVKNQFMKRGYLCEIIDVDNINNVPLSKLISFYENRLELSLVLIYGKNQCVDVQEEVTISIDSNLKTSQFSEDKFILPVNFSDDDLENMIKYIEMNSDEEDEKLIHY